MNTAQKIREKNIKLKPGDDPSEPINEEMLIVDCLVNGGEQIKEGVFVFPDQSVLDTLDSFTTAYASMTDYVLKTKKIPPLQIK